MKRLLVLMIALLVFTAPALAQTSTFNPAAYLPANLPVYLQVRTDAAGINALTQLIDFRQRMTNALGTPPALESLFAGVDLRTDILPWLGDQVGIGVFRVSLTGEVTGDDLILVLPVRDPVTAQAFVAKISAGAAAASLGAVRIYRTETVGLAVGTGVIWLSTPQGIDTLISTPMLERLNDNAAYQKVLAALPTDALITGYVDGSYAADRFALADWFRSPDAPRAWTLLEAALRLNPAQSAAEDALLAAPKLDGIGFALQVDGDRLDATAAVSFDATYPAPTLPTATAGTALLSLIPAKSFAVITSYDLSIPVMLAAFESLIPQASNGGTFTVISASIDGTPPPTLTPTPTPTAAPPMSADLLLAQVQPLLTQAQSLMGLSLDQVYSLIDGEYAVAVFPGAGPTIGAALYLQSSDPQRIIDTLERVSHLILTDPTTGQQLFTVEHSSIEGVDVALISQQGASSRLALGIIDHNILFLTQEDTLMQVIDAAAHPSAASLPITWRSAVGAGQEALFYVDARTLDLYTLGRLRNPLLPVTAFAGAFDVRDNGLFILRLTAVMSS